MSLPHTSRPDDQELIRYLLGLVSDQDAERLDEMSIVDDDVAGRLRAVENDLMDSYLRGTLTGETLERFESVYLASPLRRQKVEFASSLLRAVDRAAVPADQEPASEAVPESVAQQDASRHAVLRSKTAWLLSVAAALLLCASGALLVRNIQVARELNESRREHATLSQRVSDLEQQLKSQEAAHADAMNQLERVRAAQSAVQQNVSDIRPSDRGAPRSLSTIALMLSPMTR